LGVLKNVVKLTSGVSCTWWCCFIVTHIKSFQMRKDGQNRNPATSWVNPERGQGIFLCPGASRLVLEPTQPPIHGNQNTFLGGEWLFLESTTHLHLAMKWRMSRNVSLNPQYVFMVCTLTVPSVTNFWVSNKVEDISQGKAAYDAIQ
jgi:hypothetical protein